MNNTKPLKVLIADDDPVVRETFNAFLKEAAFTVYLAVDGQEAIEDAKSYRPDIIFLDLVMPSMDGFEALQQLQTFTETRNIPVIIVTSKTDTETLMRALKLGARDFISKPFLKGDLYRKVDTFVRNAASDNNEKPVVKEKSIAQSEEEKYREMRIEFIRNFEQIYLELVKHTAGYDTEALKETLSNLLNSVNYFKFRGAKEKVLQMRLAVSTGDWASAIDILEILYNLFRDLQRTLPVKKNG